MSGRTASNRDLSSLLPLFAHNHVATFVRCLHLLDLDLLEDWPGVTEQLFTAKAAQQNLQQRVKAVEWSLYRLFEIYDPDETKDKLRPFFPPAAPLQSLNLRAALYRCLTELKKNGVLGKDALLRKTMLDDCKGERFEEVVASFALSVLKRSTGVPITVATACASDPQLLALAIAYKASLRNNLQIRKDEDERAKQELQQLAFAEAILQERLEQSKAIMARIDVVKQQEMRALVETNWIGNNTWTEILLGGLRKKSVLGNGNPKNHVPTTNASQALFDDLDRRIKQHQARLSEWRVIAKDVVSKRPLDQSPAEPKVGPLLPNPGTSLRFSKHRALNLVDSKTISASPPPTAQPYAELLAAMRQELAPSTVTAQKSTINSNTSLPAPQNTNARTDSLPLTELTDRSEDLPQPITMMSNVDTQPVAATSTGVKIVSSNDSRPSSSPSSMHSSGEDSLWIPDQRSGVATAEQIHFAPIEQASSPFSKTPEPPMSPSKLWMSLADRTRASMAFTGRQSILPDPDSPVGQDGEQLHNQTSPDMHSSSIDNHHTTLLERTRQSMSMFTNSSILRAQKARQEKKVSQVHPVNQFEEPSRTRHTSEVKTDSVMGTLENHLLDQEAEYSSIFKSRPKLALSPAFSLERRTSGFDSISEQEVDRLNLNSDENVDWIP